MLKEHKRMQNEQQQQTEKKRQAAVKAVNSFNQKFMEKSNSGVAVAYQNQCRVNKDMKSLQVEATRFIKLSHSWTSELDKFQTALKELGDVQSWSSSIEQDLEQILNGLERKQLNPSDK